MGDENKVARQLQKILAVAIGVLLLLIIGDIFLYFINTQAGIVVSLIALIFAISFSVVYYSSKKTIKSTMVDFAPRYGQVQKQLLKEHIIPYALLDDTGKIMWMNNAFMATVDKDKDYRKSITSIFPVITKELLQKDVKEHIAVLEYNDRILRINIRKVFFEELYGEDAGADDNGYLFTVYLYDETELNKYITENEEQKLISGLIYIDNYEEALDTIEAVKRSMMSALIDRRINKYIDNIQGITKKIEKDKYFIIFKQKYLKTLEDDKFSILEDVKGINIGNEMAVTLSIGIGVNSESYPQSYEYARMAMDLALGRGGDQAVVKTPERISYYGGNTKQVDKNTRVKARVKAHVLREIIEAKDKVVVMGHSIADVDSFGAAIGVYRMAKVLNKKATIIINDITSSVRPLIDLFIENEEYPEDMFATEADVDTLVDYNTALIIVDVNKPSFTEAPKALELTKTIVVLDHHRQGAEVIQNAVLSYVEPYASSTCEMVAEILQYFTEGIKLQGIEADCIYAGIMIDTNNFMSKTGVRTFEAAAYLRRCGADVTRVRKMFRNDMGTYKARAEAVRYAEEYKGFAISVCPGEGVESPTIVGAQAANELLNIIGVKASIVLTDYNGKIYVSARSIDEVNVQILMEKLGGGGHVNIAGAQMEGATIEEAKEKIKKIISEMIERGDI